MTGNWGRKGDVILGITQNVKNPLLTLNPNLATKNVLPKSISSIALSLMFIGPPVKLLNCELNGFENVTALL